LKKKIKQFLVWSTLITSFSGGIAPVWAEEKTSQETGSNPYAAQEARIHEVLQKVMEEHLNSKLDINRLTDGAIRGMLEETGDPYTTYFTDEEFGQFYSNLEGTFTGIGVYIQQRDNKLFVESIFEDSPAAKADVRAGDEIIAVDGKRVAGQSVDDVAEWMKGETGSAVELTLKREGKEHTVSLTREVLQVSPVDSVMLDNKIGYIALYTFADNSADVFAKHLKKLQNDGAQGLIIDLRDNGGGYVDAALAIADMFIDKGALLHVQDRTGKTTDIPAKQGSVHIPTVVLVNGGTASASEVLAGALQDDKVATVIGTKTFGKGVVQELMPLQKGGVLKLTVEEYFSPLMHKINGQGITPDIVVENSDEQVMKAVSYLHGSTSLYLYPNGTAGVAGFPAGNSIAKKINGKWFVALRPFAQLYGGQIYWDGARQQATLRYGEVSRNYTTKNNTYVRNEKGTLWVSLDKLDSDFSSIYLEKQGGNIIVHVK
jgi:carboxyl-terminal processing protease